MTPRQHELFQFISWFLEEYEYSPSLEEMKIAIGAPSKSVVHRMLGCLEEQGKIVRLPNRARAIEIPDNPTMERSLSGVPLNELVQELGRRGYVAGRVEQGEKNRRTFKELAL